MFHFSADRLAGLDDVILKITASPKVPTLIPNPSFHHDTYAYDSVRKLKKQKARQETRPPLADKIASNNLAPRPPRPTSFMLLHTPSTVGEVTLVSPKSPSFRPLPPVPSASALQLPPFLNFSAESLDTLSDPSLCRPTASPPASALFYVSSPAPPVGRVTRRKAADDDIIEGPQWIPAFHHPNSPYVPWSPAIRRRILPPTSPPVPSPLSPSSPCIRPGAVAPEPWTSSTFSSVHGKPRRERLSNSWKKFRNSIKQAVKTVVLHVGKPTKCLNVPCTSRDMLHTYDDADATFDQPHLFSEAMRTADVVEHSRSSCDLLASFVSSDSRTLGAWLAERRALRVADDIAAEMTVEEYELMGSWLELRHCDDGWLCGIQNCDVHTASGSLCATRGHPSRLRTAMPLDSAVGCPLRSTRALACPQSAPPRFRSLPCFDTHAARKAGRRCRTCMGTYS